MMVSHCYHHSEKNVKVPYIYFISGVVFFAVQPIIPLQAPPPTPPIVVIIFEILYFTHLKSIKDNILNK